MELLEDYEIGLTEYVAIPDVAHLVRGRELGRVAAEEGIGLPDLSRAHHRVLERLVDDDEPMARSQRIIRAEEFFAESLAGFDRIYRAQISTPEDMQEQLSRAQHAAERSGRAKSEFLSTMSHEMRTPLNAILGFGQLLQLGNLTEEQRESVQHIDRAGHRLLSMIDDVLEIARGESELAESRVIDLVESLEASATIAVDTATVLYVEDNESNVLLVQGILAQVSDIDLVIAPNGRTGFEMACKRHPAVILLDLGLPDVSGEEVLSELRRDDRTKSIPIVVVSADATPTTIDRLSKRGADAYVTKPIDVEEFIGIVEGLATRTTRRA